MSENLEGAVIVVTGAARGLGRAMCVALDAAGAIVVATDLHDASDVPAALFLQHDVTLEESWRSIHDVVEKRFGKVHALVNNAGRSHTTKLEDMPIEEWRSLQSVNVESIFHSFRVFLDLLKSGGEYREGGASIVNVSSIAGLRGARFNAAYSATKGAVRLLTKSAALEFAALGYPIRVNSLHPGSIETDMIDALHARSVSLGLVASTQDARAQMIGHCPMRRLGAPKEIAAAVAFLCSTSSSFMTGSEVVVDGGTTSR